jgi:hypothetical protein
MNRTIFIALMFWFYGTYAQKQSNYISLINRIYKNLIIPRDTDESVAYMDYSIKTATYNSKGIVPYVSKIETFLNTKRSISRSSSMSLYYDENHNIVVLPNKKEIYLYKSSK